MKRTYVLVAISTAQLLVGSLMFYGAAAPVRMSGDVLIVAGAYHHFEFGIVGSGRLFGNLSELQSRPVDLFVFDDRGYASFRDGTNTIPPFLAQNGTSFNFSVNLADSGQYHVVLVDFPARGALQIHRDLTVVGLKTNETILAVVVLVGGMALLGATLTLSVWAWRHHPPVPDPRSASLPDPLSAPPNASQDPPDDNTRVY